MCCRHERTPVDEALHSGHQAVVDVINEAMAHRKTSESPTSGENALASLENGGEAAEL